MRFQRKNEVPCLDGFRGLLAIWLFWFHIHYFDKTIFSSNPQLLHLIKGGPMGVDGFFALSGFILTHVYHESFESVKTTTNFLTTYLKFLYFRVARIWPLHAVMSALWIKPYIFDWRCTKEEYLMEITFTTPMFKPEKWVGICNAASWSIINEFYAYLCFPFFYYFLTKLNKNNSAIKNIMMILFVLGVLLLDKWLWHYYLNHEWKFEHLKYFDINMTLFEFFVGMAFYRIYEKYNSKHWINDLIVVSLFGLIVFLCMNYNYMDNYQIYSYIILVFPFFLVKMNSFMFCILNSAIFKFLGDISFSLYLSHAFWINYFKAKVFFILKIYLFYNFLDWPQRKHALPFVGTNFCSGPISFNIYFL